MPAIQTIKLRRGTAAQWSSANPVLAAGEMGVETDTRKFKFGTGSAQWNSISYASSGSAGGGGGFFVAETAPVGPNIGDVWYCSASTGELAGRSFIRYDGYWVELNPGVLGPKGTDGAAGADGADGAAATISVGTVTTGAAGSSATVTNTGTSSAAVFAFSIPQGIQGIQGVPGADGADGADGAPGESGVLTAVAVSSNITLASKNRYFVDTTAVRTLTLPAAPALGDEVQVFDATGTAGTNNITVLNNSLKINGVTDSALLDVNGVAAVFIYTGSTYGWRLG